MRNDSKNLEYHSRINLGSRFESKSPSRIVEYSQRTHNLEPFIQKSALHTPSSQDNRHMVIGRDAPVKWTGAYELVADERTVTPHKVPLFDNYISGNSFPESNGNSSSNLRDLNRWAHNNSSR